MLCKLCNRKKAFLIAKVGKAKLEVCTFCAIVERLEVLEAIDVWKTQEETRLEETDKD